MKFKKWDGQIEAFFFVFFLFELFLLFLNNKFVATRGKEKNKVNIKIISFIQKETWKSISHIFNKEVKKDFVQLTILNA